MTEQEQKVFEALKKAVQSNADRAYVAEDINNVWTLDGDFRLDIIAKQMSKDIHG